MKKITAGEIEYFVFKKLAQKQAILHFISSRKSQTVSEDLNLSFSTGEPAEAVLLKRKKLCLALGIPFENLTTLLQVHGKKIKVIKKAPRASAQEALADAMISNVKEICLMIKLADCLPILFFDPKKNVIGVAHAGWRGTVGHITRRTVEKMQKVFGSCLGDIIVGLGPCICVRCFQISVEVSQIFEKAYPKAKGVVKKTKAGYFVDLVKANQQDLIEVGIKPKNIESSKMCTFEKQKTFFSHRKDIGKTGRFGAGIMLR